MSHDDLPSETAEGRPAKNRRQVLLGAAGTVFLGACGNLSFKRPPPVSADEQILTTMRRATNFMREECAHAGGYVWSYSRDFSRRWGEMEAYPSMIWIQPPGTATVGHLYLDCYHASRDEYFYEAAAEVARSLTAAQNPAGGWNYLHDFAGEKSVRRWYETIGRNGWRLEEFHHYFGNATFDDAGTAEASQFLLRMYVEKRDERFVEALERAVRFVLDSQYDNGGWPQRHPAVAEAADRPGLPDYTQHITFNDDVARENITFLLMLYQSLGDQRALEAIYRAMAIFPATLQAVPQAGWGLQHSVETLAPAAARSYEPLALVTSTTAGNASLMMDFYEWTGDQEFLDRLPEVFAWLDSVKLPAGTEPVTGRRFPTFIELGTNRPLYNHRRGSNVVNGEYYHDYDPESPITHYSQWRQIDLEALRERFRRLMITTPADVQATSPLNRHENFELPRFFTTRQIEVSDLNSNNGNTTIEVPDEARIAELVNSLNAEGYWPTPLAATSYPYIGPGPETVPPGDYSQTLVGDRSDTSPFIARNPESGISTAAFIRNMSTLLLALEREPAPATP